MPIAAPSAGAGTRKKVDVALRFFLVNLILLFIPVIGWLLAPFVLIGMVVEAVQNKRKGLQKWVCKRCKDDFLVATDALPLPTDC